MHHLTCSTQIYVPFSLGNYKCITIAKSLKKYALLSEVNQLTGCRINVNTKLQGSNMTGSDLYVNKPHCAAAVRP